MVHSMRSILAMGAMACASGCATPHAGDAGDAPPTNATATAPPVSAVRAEKEWEPWPPADAADVPRAAPSGDVVEFPADAGGVPVVRLLQFVHERTGAVFVYDESSNQKLKSRVTWAGTLRVRQSEIVDTCRALLAANALLVIPLGPEGEGCWLVLDQSNPYAKTRATWLRENQVLGFEDQDGLLVATTFRIRDMVDTARVRQMLSTMMTQVANLGRVQDVPGSHTLLVIDFAPVVAAMKRAVDEVNRLATPPAPGIQAPPK